MAKKNLAKMQAEFEKLQQRIQFMDRNPSIFKDKKGSRISSMGSIEDKQCLIRYIKSIQEDEKYSNITYAVVAGIIKQYLDQINDEDLPFFSEVGTALLTLNQGTKYKTKQLSVSEKQQDLFSSVGER
jgi:hypothetical protein